MPDKRKHRGKHPEDDRLFAEAQLDALRSALAEYSWLLSRGYAERSSLKLVGDRYNLSIRQRTAVWRSACSDQLLHRRREIQLTQRQTRGRPIGIDGYNLLITIESALSGGLLLIGRDGCVRDLASIHGSYRKVEETIPALETIVGYLETLEIPHINWYLDRPVSNSGRLKTLMAELLEERSQHGSGGVEFNIELVNNPDDVLSAYDGVVVSSDSLVLDNCCAWWNLAAEIIEARTPDAWIIDLRSGPEIM